jgi:hypothetical protein
MVNDIYAIYESYTQKITEGTLPLPPGSGLRANANHTERQTLLPTGVKASNDYQPGGPIAGECDETQSKIDKILKTLSFCAGKADYAQMILDCKTLKDLVDKAHLAKK